MYGGDIRWNELDVFEFWNEYNGSQYNPSLLSKVLHMTAHYDYDNNGQTNMCSTQFTGDDFSADFHVFAIEWEPDKIAWYLDGYCLRVDYRYYTTLGQVVGCDISAYTLYMKNKIFPINPMNIIFNLAIQHSGNNAPNASTVFPAYMEVDWVRYYKRGSCENISISDSSAMPHSDPNYNSIIGNNISFNCSYTINQGNQLYAVADREIVLNPGFYAEEGSTFTAKIDNACSNAKNTSELPKHLVDSSQTIENALSMIRVYPTVSLGEIIIEIPTQYIEKQLYVQIVDMLGKVRFSQYLQGKACYSIKFYDCTNGMYLVQLLDDKYAVMKVEKIIISQ